MTKGALLLTGMVMLFMLVALFIYLWYDLRLEQLDRTMHLMHSLP